MNFVVRIFVLVLVAGGLAVPLLAEDAGSTAGRNSGESIFPVLGESRFMSTAFLPSPFVTTDMRSSLGIGKAFNIHTPILEIDDDVILGLEGDLLYALLDAKYQFAVQEWLAVWGRFLVNARLGNELSSMLAQGVSVHNGFEVGWLFRIWNNDRHLLSAAVSLDNAGTTWFDIYRFVSDAIDSGGITPDNNLVRSAPTVTSSFDLRYAYSASDLVGIQALIQTALGESVNREESTAVAYRLGLAVHLDLLKRKGVPMGFIGAYKIGTMPDGGDDITGRAQSFLFNISYTGRHDLGLGVDVEHQRLPLRGFDDTVSFTSAVITMQYYF
jgi:hypothetical protein